MRRCHPGCRSAPRAAPGCRAAAAAARRRCPAGSSGPLPSPPPRRHGCRPAATPLRGRMPCASAGPCTPGAAAMTKGTRRPSVLVPNVPKRRGMPRRSSESRKAVTSAQLDVSLPPVRSGVGLLGGERCRKKQRQREETARCPHLLGHPDDGADGVGKAGVDGEDALGHEETPARRGNDERGHVTGIAEGRRRRGDPPPPSQAHRPR